MRMSSVVGDSHPRIRRHWIWTRAMWSMNCSDQEMTSPGWPEHLLSDSDFLFMASELPIIPYSLYGILFGSYNPRAEAAALEVVDSENALGLESLDSRHLLLLGPRQ